MVRPIYVQSDTRILEWRRMVLADLFLVNFLEAEAFESVVTLPFGAKIPDALFLRCYSVQITASTFPFTLGLA